MMRGGILRTIRLGVSSLALHKLRSALTTLGVLFGTASVIAMLAIGEGANQEAQEQIKQLGSQNVILRSIRPPEQANQGSQQQSRVLSYGLTRNDLDRVKTFPGVSRVVPVREVYEEVRYRDRALHPRVLATLPSYLDVTGRLLGHGRFIGEEDDRRTLNVCVLGTEVARHLFPLDTPLGKEVRIGGDYFVVVGTLAPRVRLASDPAAPGTEVTGEVFIPLKTGQKWWGDMQVVARAGSRDMIEVELDEVVVEVDSDQNVTFVADACRTMLAQHHDQNDYEVVVPYELLERKKATQRIFSIVLGSIAGISLLVGGIGIMNVMLATVTERTREIGIRRALGAKRRHIVTQFLVETVVLSVGGGLLGVAAGMAIPAVVEHFAEMRTVVTVQAPVIAFFISALIGIVFGIYPAWRAATMDPVEALRHE